MNILFSGYNGKMGSKVYQRIQAFGNFFFLNKEFCNYDDSFLKKMDACIDFSVKEFAEPLIQTLLEHHIPVLTGTTGMDIEALYELAKKNKTSFVYLPSYSKFIYYLYRILPIFPKDFEINLIETHQNTKKDSPSGTALALAKEIQLNPKEIQSVRIKKGNPTHEIQILGEGEILILKHIALDRACYLPFIEELLFKILSKEPIYIHDYSDLEKMYHS